MVATFSEIAGKRITIRYSNLTRNVGSAITVNAVDPQLYLVVEKQIGYILFGSDALARARFIDEFVTRIDGSMTPIQSLQLKMRVYRLVETVVDAIELHRILWLWGKVYEGSVQDMRDRIAQFTSDLSETELAVALVRRAAGLPVKGVLVPFIDRAMAAVEGGGYLSTLVAARGLVTSAVDMHVMDTDMSTSASERVRALAALVEGFGELPGFLQKEIGCYFPLERVDEASLGRARDTAKAALDLGVRDTEAAGQLLTESRQKLQEVLRRVRSTQTSGKDRWLHGRGLQSGFRDFVSGEDMKALDVSEARAVRQLRSAISRAVGRRLRSRTDTGTEIDVQAYIERLGGSFVVECFHSDRPMRGFSALVLVDLSESMEGAKIGQAEKAVRVLSRALDFPFVRFFVWGFRMCEVGEVSIVRYPLPVDRLLSKSIQPEGLTPLAPAIGLALRHLAELPGTKHLFIVTDGAPSLETADGKSVSLPALIEDTRRHVLRARASNVHVTTLLIGEPSEDGVAFELPDRSVRRMFGHRGQWRHVTPDNLFADLFTQISCSVLSHTAN